MSLELETLIALPERVETADVAIVGVGQANWAAQSVYAPAGAAFGSIAVGAAVVDGQANIAGIRIVQ